MPRNPNYAIQGEFRGARAIITNLNQIATQLDVTRLAATKTFAIDRQVKNFGIQMNLNAAATTQMADTITGLSNVTGLSTDKTGALVNAMAAAGLTAEDLDESLRGQKDTFDAISRGGAKNLEMMAEMTGRHGLAATAVIKTDASLKNMGGSLGDLGNKVTKWQREFKVPGMIAQIPVAVAFAEKAFIKFSALLGVTADKLIADSLKTGAALTKVYGVDIAQAVALATQNQQHFVQQAATNADVFLGLSDSFGPLTNAMFEAGMQFHEIQELIKKGQEEPAAYARQVLNMKKQMEATYGEGSVFVQRWYQQTLRASSEVTQKLIAEEGALKRLEAAQKAAAKERESEFGKGKASFAEMTGALRKVGATALDTLKNLLNLGKSIIGLSVVDDVSKSFEDLHDWAKALNIRIKGLATSFAKWRDENKETVAGMQRVIKYGAILGATAATLASAAAALVLPLVTMKVVLTKLPIVGGPVTALFNGLGKAALFFGKKILLPITLIYTAIKALEGFGAALADPNLGGAEAMLKGVENVFVGIVGLFDDLLMGIPTKIVKFFFPKMRGTLVDGVKRIFRSLQAQMVRAGNSTFSAVFAKLAVWAGEKLDAIWGYMKTRLEGWKQSAGEIGKNIGRAVGQLAQWAWKGIKWLFNPSNWKKGWDKIVAWFDDDGGPALGGSLKKIFSGLVEVAGEFTENFADEVLGGFGYSFDDLKADFMDVIDWLNENVVDYFNLVLVGRLAGAFKLMNVRAKEQMALLTESWSKGWNTIKENTSILVGAILEATIAPMIKGYAKAVFLYEKLRYALAPDSPKNTKRLMDAQIEYTNSMETADALGTAISESTQDRIAQSEIDFKKYAKSAKKAREEYDKWNLEAAEERVRKEDLYRTRSEERAKNRAERRAKAERSGRGKRAKSATEKLNAETLGAWAEEMRGGFTGRTEELLGVLRNYQGQAAEAGNVRGASSIGRKISIMEDALNKLWTMNDPDKMMNLMKEIEGVAGKTVTGKAQASNAYQQAIPTNRPATLDVEEAVNKAMGKAIPAPAPAPAPAPGPEIDVATYMRVLVEGRIKEKQVYTFALKPGVKEVFSMVEEFKDVP